MEPLSHHSSKGKTQHYTEGRKYPRLQCSDLPLRPLPPSCDPPGLSNLSLVPACSLSIVSAIAKSQECLLPFRECQDCNCQHWEWFNVAIGSLDITPMTNGCHAGNGTDNHYLYPNIQWKTAQDQWDSNDTLPSGCCSIDNRLCHCFYGC